MFRHTCKKCRRIECVCELISSNTEDQLAEAIYLLKEVARIHTPTLDKQLHDLHVSASGEVTERNYPWMPKELMSKIENLLERVNKP